MRKITNNHNFDEVTDFRVTFNGSQTINEFYSQAGQDIYVLSVLNGKKNGVFLDIGSAWPKYINNTFLLENKFGWSGTLIEIDEELTKECLLERKSNVICNDATKVNYNDIFNELGDYIDYMSLDIDGQPSLDVLNSLPLNGNNVGVITFEHDSYRVGPKVRNESRDIFNRLGYFRICSDVGNPDKFGRLNIYEDWYVSKEIYDDKIKDLVSDKSSWKSILFK